MRNNLKGTTNMKKGLNNVEKAPLEDKHKCSLSDDCRCYIEWKNVYSCFI